MNIRLVDLDLVQVVPKGQYLEVDLEGVDINQLLEEISTQEIVDTLGDDLLDAFDKDTVINHFNIKEAEEE